MGSLTNGDSTPAMKFLIYGKTGWIGGVLGKLCESQNIPYVYGSGRLENRPSLEADLAELNPTHVFNAAGVTGRPNVDWCETHKVETIRANVAGTLTLADVCNDKGIPLINFATGCIFEYDEKHQIGSGVGFKEEDTPNFIGSFYSKTKAMVEELLKNYPTVCTLRVRMPISSDLSNPRNFIAKIVRYDKVVNIPNSMTILDELLPISIEMRGDNGWECFSGSSPRDCLAYSYFRLSHEALDLPVKITTLNKALESAETELAKRRINEELEKRLKKVGDDEGDELLAKVAVPVVRLRYGELTEWTSIAVLPVCSSGGDKQSIMMAPRSTFKGKFGVVESESGWKRWVVLPGWDPLLSTGNGVAVEFENAKMLPWKTKKWLREEEVMVVVDRERKEVKEEVEFYLVCDGSDMGDKLKVERGKDVKESDLVLGSVVLVVRPPRYQNDDDQVQDTDWE